MNQRIRNALLATRNLMILASGLILLVTGQALAKAVPSQAHAIVLGSELECGEYLLTGKGAKTPLDLPALTLYPETTAAYTLEIDQMPDALVSEFDKVFYVADYRVLGRDTEGFAIVEWVGNARVATEAQALREGVVRKSRQPCSLGREGRSAKALPAAQEVGAMRRMSRSKGIPREPGLYLVSKGSEVLDKSQD
jgi:hypothetical protein